MAQTTREMSVHSKTKQDHSRDCIRRNESQITRYVQDLLFVVVKLTRVISMRPLSTPFVEKADVCCDLVRGPYRSLLAVAVICRNEGTVRRSF